jgi:UDP-glucose-4-epimerase GalE
MHVLVTGGSGYVGSHVAKMLNEHGHKVTVVDRMSKTKTWSNLGWTAISDDIKNKWALDRLFEEDKIDAVIHLAASSEVGPSVTDPLNYYENNVYGSLQVLNACDRHGCNKFVFSSTSAVYGEVHPSRLPTCEYYPKNPATSYGTSKWTTENMLRDVDRAHGIRSVSLRYFNASGASPDGKIGEWRETPTHLIPSIQAYLEGRVNKITINGNDYATPDGTAVRDYTHVWDIASAHVNALDYLNKGGETTALNIGAGKGHSVLDIINEFEKQLGIQLDITYGPRRPGDIPINFADIAEAKKVLGWQPIRSDPYNIVKDALNWYNSKTYRDLLNGYLSTTSTSIVAN